MGEELAAGRRGRCRMSRDFGDDDGQAWLQVPGWVP